MTAYYNENDPATVFWLRELIGAGMVAPGIVDDRSIEDVLPSDLKGFTQCHFFAGVGGWSYALRLAGWDDDRPVWTGSCPCQPFSSAGQGKGFADERHLWPAWFWLINQCRPVLLFGEQVGKVAGLRWLDTVFDDLESSGYTCGATDKPACSVGAPHLRQRLFWMANIDGKGLRVGQRTEDRRGNVWEKGATTGKGCTLHERLVYTNSKGWVKGRETTQTMGQRHTTYSASKHDSWRNPEWLRLTDGSYRPTQPGLCPLAHGVPGRMELLRGYGNAIVPQVAAEFVQAAMTL